MARDNFKKTGISSKQKLTVSVLLVVLLIIIWQIMGLFGGENATTITPVSTPSKKNASPTTAPETASSSSLPNSSQTVGQQELKQAPVSMSNSLLELQKKSDQQYVEQLNQLQMLKIQREIAETNQAIASAKLATVTAEKGVSNLLISHSTNNFSPPPSTTSSSTEISLPTPTPEAPYKLISVSMQRNKWNAVLEAEGKMYYVGIGDTLPLDGAIVRSINKNAIILEKEGNRKKISMTESI